MIFIRILTEINFCQINLQHTLNFSCGLHYWCAQPVPMKVKSLAMPLSIELCQIDHFFS